MVESSNRLRILLCSDIHAHWENLDKLLAQETQKSFDFVFVSGDQSNCLNKIDEPDTQEMNTLAEEDNARIIDSLRVMHKETGNLFFIPGNHDAESLMRDLSDADR